MIAEGRVQTLIVPQFLAVRKVCYLRPARVTNLSWLIAGSGSNNSSQSTCQCQKLKQLLMVQRYFIAINKCLWQTNAEMKALFCRKRKSDGWILSPESVSCHQSPCTPAVLFRDLCVNCVNKGRNQACKIQSRNLLGKGAPFHNPHRAHALFRWRFLHASVWASKRAEVTCRVRFVPSWYGVRSNSRQQMTLHPSHPSELDLQGKLAAATETKKKEPKEMQM